MKPKGLRLLSKLAEENLTLKNRGVPEIEVRVIEFAYELPA